MLHSLNYHSMLLAVVLVVNIFSANEARAYEKRELVFLSWPEYIDPEVVRDFEEHYGASVRLAYFETDDMRDNLMIQTEAAGYDLVVISDNFLLRKYRKLNWITELSKKQVPNLKNIDKTLLEKFGGGARYGMPYFWGTTGIAYRKDLLGREISSWRDLFVPEMSLKGKIVMIQSGRDVIGMALKMLGYSNNSESEDEIMQAGAILRKQKPFVRDYTYPTLDENSALVTGDIHMAMLYNGDALMLRSYEENIEFVLPEEGGNIWMDYIAVTQKSSNKALAYDFLNFISRPENAARIAEFVHYATPNKAAEEFLPEEFLSNPIIYPTEDIIALSEPDKKLTREATKLRNQIFSSVIE